MMCNRSVPDVVVSMLRLPDGTLLLAAALLAGSCGSRVEDARAPDRARVQSAAATITGDEILGHIRVLSADGFEGRGPGTPGEASTVAYLTRELQRMGLEPGNPDGTYTQEVPLVGITSTWTASVDVKGRTIRMRFPDDYAPASLRIEPETKVERSEIVFVGYGVVAPEYGWDDYKGVDVRGK